MNAKKKETHLSVPDMSCGSCVTHVTRALEQLDGVEDIRVSLREGQVRVVHDPNRSPVEQLVKKLAADGYEAVQIE